ALAQSPEAGRLTLGNNGQYAKLIVDSGRPLDSAAITLAEKFGIPVSVEDPPYLYQDDVKDVTEAVSRLPNPPRRVLVPKGGMLEVEFTPGAAGAPEDTRVLLNNLINQANSKFPFGYRLDDEGGAFTLIPTHTRDTLGRQIEITPLLDRRVSITAGTRTIAETANLMTAELSAQTGLRVSCCQAFVAGIPWGMTSVTFEAHDEPARSVLKRLIASDLQGKPNGYYWLQRCDPLPSAWCFINLSYLPGKAERIHAEQAPSKPRGDIPSSPDRRLGSSKWFDSTPSKTAPRKIGSSLILAACNRDPWYAPPPQRTPVLADNHPRGWTIGMGDPAADMYIVRDIGETVEGGTWRWTYERPELRFWLDTTANVKLSVEFLCSGLTLPKTGPVTISFFVNGHLLGAAACASPGTYRFEKPVPSAWLHSAKLDSAKPEIVSAQADKLWTAPADGKKLGFILISAGFVPGSRE
ncbi:MAG: hypothetical protein M3Z23_07205, partial [Acidobacteriota bacterium]|nr:hypothetical protein [Acidobacteriota bacterium]